MYVFSGLYLQLLYIDMDINTQFCALCCKSSKSHSYDLKTTKSSHTKTPLIFLLERVQTVSLLLFDICEECCLLLNELDALNVRFQEIHKVLKDYIKLQSLNNGIDNRIIENNQQNVIHLESKEITKQESVIFNNVIDNIKNRIIDDVWEATESTTTKFSEKIAADNIKYDLEFDYDKPKHLKATVIGNVDKNSSVVTSEACDCGKTFGTDGELNSHLISHETPFICEICGQGYKQKSQFNIHMNMHNGTDPFVCVYCKKSFTQKIGLARHVTKHTGEKPYQCEVCGKTFAYHTSFSAHKQSHIGVKKSKCSFCGLELMSTSHLKRHLRIHTGEKRFACNTCGKRFAERYNLVAHEKIHLYRKLDCSTRRQ